MMVKSNKRTSSKKKATKKIQLPAQRQALLDANALAYARLLADPCGAPLVNPVYAGGDAGYITRYENDFTLDAVYDFAQSNGGLLFTPGLIGVSALNTLSISGNNSVMGLGSSTEAASTLTDTVIASWRTRAASMQPGSTAFSFLSSSVRTVAACMQVYYVGTELNRRGIISLGKVNAGSVLSNDTASVSGVRQVSTEVFRTPDSHVEYRWSPSDGDQLFTDPSLISSQREAERKSGILMSFAGIPREDIRVRLVAVYEWQPNPGQGVVNPAQNRNRSNYTLDNVLNYLDKNGPWLMSGAQSIYRMMGGGGANQRRITYG